MFYRFDSSQAKRWHPWWYRNWPILTNQEQVIFVEARIYPWLE